MKHVLDLPFGADELKEKYGLKTIKGGFSLYSGVLLPRELRPYKSEDFSYIRWLEDEANAHVSVPDKNGKPLPLDEDQTAAVEKILEAYKSNSAGYIMAQKRGHGQELVALTSVAAMAKSLGTQSWDDDANKAKLLIVTPKGFTAHWRNLIKRTPVVTALARPLIITPSQLNKLLMAPPAARIAAKKSTKERSTSRNGVPTIDWDFIVFDHPHLLGEYPASATAASAAAVAKLNKTYQKTVTPFVLYLLNVVESNPLHLALMSKVLSPSIKAGEQIIPAQWADFLKAQRFAIRPTAKGAVWMGDPPKRGPDSKLLTSAQVEAVGKRDALRIARILKKAPFTKLALQEQTPFALQALPLDLKGGHKIMYESIWRDLKTWLNRHLMNTDPEGYARQSARYFWRVNDLKKDYILELVAELVENGDQAYVKVPTVEAIEFYAERLAKKKISFVTLTAQNEADHEEMMEAFEEGKAKVMLATDFLGEPTVPMNVIPVVVLTDVQMMAALKQDYSSFFRKPPALVYLPYIERTLEEALQELVLTPAVADNGYNVPPIELERLLRLTAARTTPPNRMS